MSKKREIKKKEMDIINEPCEKEEDAYLEYLKYADQYPKWANSCIETIFRVKKELEECKSTNENQYEKYNYYFPSIYFLRIICQELEGDMIEQLSIYQKMYKNEQVTKQNIVETSNMEVNKDEPAQLIESVEVPIKSVNPEETAVNKDEPKEIVKKVKKMKKDTPIIESVESDHPVKKVKKMKKDTPAIESIEPEKSVKDTPAIESIKSEKVKKSKNTKKN